MTTQHPGGAAWAELAQKAQAIDAEFRQRLNYIDAAAHLSPVGKRQEFEAAQAKRVSSVAALQEQAAALLERQKADAAKKVQVTREKDLQRRRELIGDDAIVRQWERLLPKLDGMRILAVWEDAAGWERDVLAELAQAELVLRMEAGEMAGGTQHAYLTIRAAVGADLAAAEDAAQDVERSGRQWVEQLDLDGQRLHIANTLGVNYGQLVSVATAQTA